MTTKGYKFRGNQQVEDEDGFLRDGESYRVPCMICDAAGQMLGLDEEQVRRTLTDRASDPRATHADRLAARDALTRLYAAMAVTPLYVHKNPGLFDKDTREAVGAPAGRDQMEAVYAAYDAHIRDAWRNGQPPATGTRDEAYDAYAARLRDSCQRG